MYVINEGNLSSSRKSTAPMALQCTVQYAHWPTMYGREDSTGTQCRQRPAGQSQCHTCILSVGLLKLPFLSVVKIVGDPHRHRSSCLLRSFCASKHKPEVTRKSWFQRQTHRQTTELHVCTLYIAQCGMRQSLRRMRSCIALHSSVCHIMGVAVHCGPYCGCCSALWEYLSWPFCFYVVYVQNQRKSEHEMRRVFAF